VELVRINIGARWHTAAYSGDRKGSYVTNHVTKARRSRPYAFAFALDRLGAILRESEAFHGSAYGRRGSCKPDWTLHSEGFGCNLPVA
jgi:hypothetical protein